jgi:hypothetical protein
MREQRQQTLAFILIALLLLLFTLARLWRMIHWKNY